MQNPKVGDRVVYRGDYRSNYGKKGTIAAADQSNFVMVRFDESSYIEIPFSKYSLVKLKPKQTKPPTPPKFVYINFYESGDFGDTYDTLRELETEGLRDIFNPRLSRLVYNLDNILPVFNITEETNEKP